MPSALSVVEAKAKSKRTEPVTTHAFRGLRPIPFASFDQGPLITWSSPSKSGRRGQKIQRPKINRRAGSKVRIVIIEHTIPIAPIGPRPAVFVSWLKSKIRSEIATVDPEARIGSHTPL
ncbi:unannotated protein [freshwater metagenome]|uniref:Unannotated protein n=1 Tax=freshwater metagenome TaxID=449393 RepID=A0A6J7TIH9_9ZZZZ